ncbi:hypothetical protein [Pseudomonas syringae]|uniref:hypothetical protein n=1 Tax=Pseudomonas syringae TaxID=317 RepID=UPI0013C2FEFD|nr:hypothetical protein [Pseudomonas syringae]
MALGNFRCRLRDSVEILATHKGDVKTRLYLAINNRLVLANIPEVPELPEKFREELDANPTCKGFVDNPPRQEPWTRLLP